MLRWGRGARWGHGGGTGPALGCGEGCGGRGMRAGPGRGPQLGWSLGEFLEVRRKSAAEGSGWVTVGWVGGGSDGVWMENDTWVLGWENCVQK